MTNTIKIEKFKIFWELPKCNTKTQSEQVLLEKIVPVDLLEEGLLQTFNL